jgi:hypothetical protein
LIKKDSENSSYFQGLAMALKGQGAYEKTSEACAQALNKKGLKNDDGVRYCAQVMKSIEARKNRAKVKEALADQNKKS